MKISYTSRWNRDTGTHYGQTIRITHGENQALFKGMFKPGMNYGNAYTGAEIARVIYGKPEYKKQLDRIITANTCVFVGAGTMPIY